MLLSLKCLKLTQCQDTPTLACKEGFEGGTTLSAMPNQSNSFAHLKMQVRSLLMCPNQARASMMTRNCFMTSRASRPARPFG
ncbi:MAG: hypothetical protein QOJ40_688 [Verrucomicrobiota bacterium]